MNKIIFFTIFNLVIVNLTIAQDNNNESVPTNLNVDKPMLDWMDMEREFGGYKAPNDPDPLPNFASPDNVYPNPTILAPVRGANNKGDLKSLENSLLTPEKIKDGGSIMKPLSEIETQKNAISNSNFQENNNSLGFIIIFILIILFLILFFLTKKKNKDVKKIDINLENQIEFDPTILLNNLEKLEELKNKGTISDEEFITLKNKIIKKLN